MSIEITEFDQMQADYKNAVEAWIAAIREEETLASTDRSVDGIDLWEQAGNREDVLRSRVKASKNNARRRGA